MLKDEKSCLISKSLLGNMIFAFIIKYQLYENIIMKLDYKFYVRWLDQLGSPNTEAFFCTVRLFASVRLATNESRWRPYGWYRINSTNNAADKESRAMHSRECCRIGYLVRQFYCSTNMRNFQR